MGSFVSNYFRPTLKEYIMCFVDAEWLDVVKGKVFFYPSAGRDCEEALDVFAGHIDTFWFADIGYRPGLKMAPVKGKSSRFKLLSSARSGEPNASMETRKSETGHQYRDLAPSRLEETYERVGDGRRISVVRRRGFGQCALSSEFADNSIGIFMHRGDTPGEGGSNVYYLANQYCSHEPLSNLFDKLSRMLTDRALIVTDGSNCCINRVKRWHWKQEVKGPAAFHEAQAVGFEFGGWSWKCVGFLGNRYGPTLVWGVTRLEK
jgi:hypothetical protein